MHLASMQIGPPRTYDGPRPWTSAIKKEPVEGQLWAGREGLSGDHQHNRQHHGGPERALLMYSADHYPRWRAEWERTDVGPGAFGENLTVAGVTEDSVCIGDIFRIGDVRVEVSSPRTPCSTLSRRHGVPELVKTIVENHRSGWYLRVLQEGWLESGMTVVLVDRPYPQWTVRRTAEVKRLRAERVEEARLLAACGALQSEWREILKGNRQQAAGNS
jgi:MOSC domain-containing protein YiiM